MKEYEIVIVGGGPAGLAAAAAAKDSGARSILILEREKELGGILNQCIHNGFGLHTFHEELTGPEYAARFIGKVKEKEIDYMLNTMVLDIVYEEANATKLVTAMNSTAGLFTIRAIAVVLAMGCRERPRGALNIPGTRPAGIFSAGTAQRLVNIEGRLPGREVVILGSGDIGLIMARRMTLEGAHVKVVAELMPYCGGLKRNVVQCLDDYGIPLKLQHTVVDIRGRERVKGVTLAQVDDRGRAIPGTEEEYSCDTLLLSVGLIPENELSDALGVCMDPVTGGPEVDESLETSIKGVFACGNVLHVHDLVDHVSEEAAAAGRYAAAYAKESVREDQGRAGDRPGEKDEQEPVELEAGNGIRYTVPARIHRERMAEEVTVRFRVRDVYRDRSLQIVFDDRVIRRRRRMIMTPGEMEEITLSREEIRRYPDLKRIVLTVE